MYTGKGSYQVIPVMSKAMFAEGDFVIASCDHEMHVGRVEYVMTTGASGIPGSEYYLETSPEKPALVIRTLEFESDEQYWCETPYLISVAAMEATKISPLPLELDADVVELDGQMSVQMEDMPMQMMDKADGCCPEDGIEKQEPCWDGYVQRGMKPGENGRPVPNCVPVEKADEPMPNGADEMGCTADSPDCKNAMCKACAYKGMNNIGRDYTKSTSMRDLFKSVGIGSAVSWNSSGGRAEGKVTRIIRNGKYNVPGTSVSVNGTEEDPVAVIRLYRDGKPTDTIVAHKVKTLRAK